MSRHRTPAASEARNDGNAANAKPTSNSNAGTVAAADVRSTVVSGASGGALAVGECGCSLCVCVCVCQLLLVKNGRKFTNLGVVLEQ